MTCTNRRGSKLGRRTIGVLEPVPGITCLRKQSNYWARVVVRDMKCPVDSIDLIMSERSGVEIDYCPQCRGVWLDRGELDKILDRAAETMGPRVRRRRRPCRR